jgi:hypothetical protein
MKTIVVNLKTPVYYFRFKYKDSEGVEHEAQYSGYLTRAEAARDKKAQQAFNPRGKNARKIYYDFTPILKA